MTAVTRTVLVWCSLAVAGAVSIVVSAATGLPLPTAVLAPALGTSLAVATAVILAQPLYESTDFVRSLPATDRHRVALSYWRTGPFLLLMYVDVAVVLAVHGHPPGDVARTLLWSAAWGAFDAGVALAVTSRGRRASWRYVVLVLMAVGRIEGSRADLPLGSTLRPLAPTDAMPDVTALMGVLGLGSTLVVAHLGRRGVPQRATRTPRPILVRTPLLFQVARRNVAVVRTTAGSLAATTAAAAFCVLQSIPVDQVYVPLLLFAVATASTCEIRARRLADFRAAAGQSASRAALADLAVSTALTGLVVAPLLVVAGRQAALGAFLAIAVPLTLAMVVLGLLLGDLALRRDPSTSELGMELAVALVALLGLSWLSESVSVHLGISAAAVLVLLLLTWAVVRGRPAGPLLPHVRSADTPDRIALT